MKILVTGGAGFVGSNYIFHMQKNHPDVEIVCLDSLTYAANIKNLENTIGTNNFVFIKGSVTDPVTVNKVLREGAFDAVLNFAAESHVDRSISNPDIFMNTNILGTQVLMDECRRLDIERYHQVSTDEVYGDLPLHRPDLKFREDSLLRPSSPYSASKAAADLLVLAYYRTYGIRTTIARCSNNYGPYQFPEKLIPKTIMLARQNKPIPIFGNGENVRDWLHAADHCSAIDLVVTAGRPGDVYNIGCNNERRNIDIVRLILREMGKSEDLIHFVGDRPGHDLRYSVDASKIRKELGWQPVYEFEQGIKETLAWYMSNIDWIDDIESGAYGKHNDSYNK
ncbi:MAG TPA: dTDP-glucose 4,6-dehydratase [Methanomassiliicoccales archaeon]